MVETMKAARFYGPRDVRVEQMAVPGALGPDEVLLKILVGGLCGSDASLYLHPTRPRRRPGPLVLGHEVVGRVLAVGKEVSTIPLGSRVVPGAGMWCGHCASCKQGRTNICDDYFLYGIQENGGLAEYAVFPAKMCRRVPEACTNYAAALAQPLAVALHALRRIAVVPGQTVAIFGVGGMGSLLLAALSVQMTGSVCLLALDREPARLEIVAGLSANHLINTCGDGLEEIIARLTNGRGVDVAIDATGHPDTPQQALSLLKNGGQLLLVGIPDQPSLLSLGEAVLSEKNILTTNGHNGLSDLEEALQLLATSDLVTRLSYRVISLDHVVSEGLLPLVGGQSDKKILVEIARED